jgi:hypothetical protein
MSDELDINSVERFSKKSDRLILEELGSCEVPAGCGGVVLRWFSMKDGLPVGVRVHRHQGEAELFCNGSPMTNGYASLPYGPGVLAILVGPRDHEFDWFSVRTFHTSRTRKQEGLDEIPEMSTAMDGSWKFTLTDPGDGWTDFELDDGNWPAMEASCMPLDSLPEGEQWRFRFLQKDEKAIFSIPQQQVWIRKRFDLSAYIPE